MVYGSHTRIGQFLTAVAQGFVQTRHEIVLFFLIVTAFLFIISLYLVAQKHRAQRERARSSREMLKQLRGKLNLNDQEAALLGRLALYLEPGEAGHASLVNHHVFDACARKMRQSEQVPETHLSALRLKIGFRITQPEDVPAASSELPEGSPLLLVTGAGTRLRAMILSQGPSAMHVKLDSEAASLSKDTRLTIYFHNSAGIFSFPSKVTEPMEDALHLEHSSHITHHQRRKYYRREEFLPAFIKPASVAAVPQESFLLELVGGGASLQNPRGLFKPGDLLEVSFSLKTGMFMLVALVLRVSKTSRVINVKFESLPETERTRIMGFLFTQFERRRLA